MSVLALAAMTAACPKQRILGFYDRRTSDLADCSLDAQESADSEMDEHSMPSVVMGPVVDKMMGYRASLEQGKVAYFLHGDDIQEAEGMIDRELGKLDCHTRSKAVVRWRDNYVV